MQGYFDTADGLKIYAYKKDTRSSSDDQRQKCVLAYFSMLENANLWIK